MYLYYIGTSFVNGGIYNGAKLIFDIYLTWKTSFRVCFCSGRTPHLRPVLR